MIWNIFCLFCIMSKLKKSLGFADLAVEKRKVKSEFFKQLDYLIDFDSIEQEIEKYYKKGNNAAGRPSHRGIVLFKMCLIGYFYNLSDYEVEERVKDSISTSIFVSLGMDDLVPDHSTISRFRTALTEAEAMDKLLEFINSQLEKANLLVKKGVIIDASFTESERKSKKQVRYEIAKDRKEDERTEEVKSEEENHHQLIKIEEPGVDSEARWLKKGNKSMYGYKKHVCTDKNGLVIAVETTAGNVSDTKLLEKVIEKSGLEKGSGGKARYIGKSKTHTEHVFEAIAYNLYRLPVLFMRRNAILLA